MWCLHLAWHPALPHKPLVRKGSGGQMEAMNQTHEQMFLAKPDFVRRQEVNFCQSGSGGRNQKIVWGVCVCVCVSVCFSLCLYMCVCVLMCVAVLLECMWMCEYVHVCVRMYVHVCVGICVYWVYMCECVMGSNIAQRLSGKFGSHIVLFQILTLCCSLAMWHGNQTTVTQITYLWHSNVLPTSLGFCER